MNTVNYEASGVSIQRGEDLVKLISKDNPNIGGFAGLFDFDEERCLVACTDGVGTKLEISIAEEAYEALGQDLVAMSVNDLIVCGARPLFFLDYFATGKLDVHVASRVIKGISSACKQVGCFLLGGETAEMPGFYETGKFDLAGFAVGEVLKQNVISGRNVVAGDVILGLPSTGFHSNGFSLVRKIVKENNLDLKSPFPGSTESLGRALTAPTALYVNAVKKVLKEVKVKAMAHITGGGLTNIQRSLPLGLTYNVDKRSIPRPPVISYIQEMGKIPNDEAYTVWNMGLGFVLVVQERDVETVRSILPDAFVAGIVEPILI